MCGIAGIINTNHAPVSPDILKKMADVLKHRGPDDEGFFMNRPEAEPRPKWKHVTGQGHVGLAHRRLSIIALDSGHQPIPNEDRSVWVTYNGEIYNYASIKAELTGKGHRFATDSDTEVIVHAYEEWGDACVQKFRGMFAFVLWDQRRDRIFAARDRVGIKPLYYFFEANRFVFGSEIKAILEHPDVPRKVRSESVSDYFHLMYVPGPESIFDGIHKLLPGHTLSIENGAMRIEEYWDISFARTLDFTEDEWCRRVLHKLEEAIDLRMLSDVPLGAFLSGGVDSGAVVALMAGLSDAPVKTASIGFADETFNELPYARRVAEQYNTHHHEKTVDADSLGILDKLVWHFDEPFADSSAIPTYYVSRIAREKVTVSLSGDGGDENFAGYRRHLFDFAENRLRGVFPEWFRKTVISGLADIYPKADRLPRFLRAKTLLTNLSREPVQGYYNSMAWFQGAPDLFTPEMKKELNGYSPVCHYERYFRKSDASCPLSRVQYTDMKTYLVDDILTKVDRASMANSLEVRVPVLDHEFMELVAAMPSNLKLKKREGKYIFKKSLAGHLPHDCMYREKKGFSIPLSSWVKNDLKSVFEDTVLSKNSFCGDYLNEKAVKRLWGQHQKGQRDFAFEIWAILVFELWGRRWLW
ncbi:asparagine synthase (glutamine-hydrolyzing) [Desulfoluna butyratoxydans]|uniref:asparagine synthase (glutamine-hydrolyzing) n=1 Tax=Desulfoluna butyratoxydans TaxID=231438 RepID=A0A4U8YKE8_9BACT|nr:asparagine synthase (glutamine-hydrolyzing) [Desulfoluna butyratoxydans]VFQ44336.1 asparagine synthase glutamine-hydrolyzing [Desulfoluna butyratoxydans]